MILRGPGAKEDEKTYDRSDVQTYDFLGKLGEEMLPGYRYFILWRDLYGVYGGELDWFHGARGIITYSNELWSSFDYFRKQVGDDDFRSGRSTVYRFDKLLLFEEGIVPWTKVKHPQYGEVEIGGVKKAWTRTAPSFMLEDLCHRNMAFTLFHLFHTPKAEVDSIMTRSLGNGLTEVTAIVANRRVIPTRISQDVKNHITRPDRVSLSGGSVVSGVVLENRMLGIGTEQKRNPERLDVETIPGMGTVSVRWIVEGKGPFTVSVDSKKGGTHTLRSR